jgi:hypothetical protein
MKNTILVPSVLALCALPGTALAESAVGRHAALAEVTAGAAIEIVADAPIAGGPPTLHYRANAATAWTSVELTRRPDDRWVAEIPAAAAAPPSLEYYIDRGAEPVFASAATPHAVSVRAAASEQRRTRDLLRVQKRRSRVHAMGEWVDYGAASGDDQYYRLEADFGYRLYAYPLEEIRVGVTRLLGNVPRPAPEDDETGYRVGGWFELGVGVAEGLRLDGRVLVLATADGFALGGRAELRVGSRDASHVALGGEYAADVGAAGFFRLGWDTVPRVPMTATIEVGNMPADDQPVGVRLIYDAYIPLQPGLRLGLRAGYAARDQELGGLCAGGGVTLDF